MPPAEEQVVTVQISDVVKLEDLRNLEQMHFLPRNAYRGHFITFKNINKRKYYFTTRRDIINFVILLSSL